MTGVTRTLVVILSLWPVIVAGCGSTSPDSERFKAGDRVDGIMGFAKVNGEVGCVNMKPRATRHRAAR